jgi:MOSC domain-containing protein YiiM
MAATDGRVEAIHLARVQGDATVGVQSVSAIAGRGLEGDYHLDKRERRGGEAGKDLTLIEAEAIECLAQDTGIVLGPGESMRNIVTRGISLNQLVGRRFTVGEAECVGVELCEPCRKLERMTQPGVLRGLVDRGGLRADIVAGGTIAVGDPLGELA